MNEKTQKCWDCLGYRVPGELCECQAPKAEAEAPSQLDELWTLEAQAEAGYQRGRYVSNNPHQEPDEALQAAAKADHVTGELWRHLYDVAPAFADALTVLDAVKGLEVQA
jgi:hypothetical protein